MTKDKRIIEALGLLNKASELLDEASVECLDGGDEILCALGGVIEEVGDIE